MTTIDPRGGAVFRVRGIPPDQDRVSLSKVLAGFFGPEINSINSTPPESGSALVLPELRAEVSEFSPSCVRRATFTALLEFKPFVPERLQQLSYDEAITVPLGGRKSVIVDSDFCGLTQLYPTVPESDIVADIVTVGDLNGNPYESWCGKEVINGSRAMWLAHFFPQEDLECSPVANCRTMIYGYNTKLDMQGLHIIPDYASSFLEELMKARSTEIARNRPLVLIGHSFGSIVITQAAIRAKETSGYGPLFSRIRSMTFFGAPHRGIMIDDILQMLKESPPRQELIESLAVSSVELKKELERFVNYATDIKILAFKEAERTKKLQQGSDGTWSRTGEYYDPATNSSSMLPVPGRIGELLSIEGDHMSMVRFSHAEATAYVSVLRQIRTAIEQVEKSPQSPPLEPSATGTSTTHRDSEDCQCEHCSRYETLRLEMDKLRTERDELRTERDKFAAIPDVASLDINALVRLNERQLSALDSGLRLICKSVLETKTGVDLRSILEKEVPALLTDFGILMDLSVGVKLGWDCFKAEYNSKEDRLRALWLHRRWNITVGCGIGWLSYESITCLDVLYKLCRWRGIV